MTFPLYSLSSTGLLAGTLTPVTFTGDLFADEMTAEFTKLDTAVPPKESPAAGIAIVGAIVKQTLITAVGRIEITATVTAGPYRVRLKKGGDSSEPRDFSVE